MKISTRKSRQAKWVVGMTLATAIQLTPALAAPVNTAAPTAASPEVSELQHRGEGVVKKIDSASGKINIEHAAIKSLGWPAMTMDFAVQNKESLTTVKPGQQVEFDLVKGRGEQYVITRIAPLR